jgi:cephalosporin hydroxylase
VAGVFRLVVPQTDACESGLGYCYRIMGRVLGLMNAPREGKFIFRPFMPSPDRIRVPWVCRRLRHPLFAWLGLRPIFAQHTQAEHQALQHWVCGRRQVVEIGVAEGASALALREAMANDGTLYLVDPFHWSRMKSINSVRRAARAAVTRSQRANVVWIEKFSYDAAADWTKTIDFLFLDGDHNQEAVWRDWENWHRFVAPGGYVAFHDAREFPNGWPTATDGPVRVVNALFRERALPGWTIEAEIHSLVVVKRDD